MARILFVSLCIRLYRYRYINLINLFGILFRNFHHQELFSLNLDLVYGGIKPKEKERARRLRTSCLQSYRTKDALAWMITIGGCASISILTSVKTLHMEQNVVVAGIFA